MWDEFGLFCNRCGALYYLNLDSTHVCPACGRLSIALANHIRIAKALTAESHRVVDDYKIVLRMAFYRAEAETGKEISQIAEEIADEIKLWQEGDHCSMEEFPKLEIVSMGFRQHKKDLRTLLHQNRYNCAHFYLGATFVCVPEWEAFANPTASIFYSQTKTPGIRPLFAEVFLFWHLLQAWNGSWYALLSDEFLLLPPSVLEESRLPVWQTD